MNVETKAALKRCTRCSEFLGLDAFYSNVRRAGGLASWCKSCEKAARSAYHWKNREQILGRKMDRRLAAGEPGKAARNESARARHRADIERYRARWRLDAKRRREGNPSTKLKDRVSRRLRLCLSTGKGGKSSESLLGYTIAELRTHLERQFLKGMSWENIGKWHIDHIVPLSSFTITGPDDPELRRAWALPNLRPLWALDNMRKSARRETLL